MGVNAARSNRRNSLPPTLRNRSNAHDWPSESTPPHIADSLIAPFITDEVSTAEARHDGPTPKTPRQPGASARELCTRIAWCALFITVLLSGTPDGTLWASSKILHFGLLLSALAACWLVPFDRRQPRAFLRFFGAWFSLPLPLLGCALLWLFGMAIAIQISIVPFLSFECSQASLSCFICAALMFGYAARGPREEAHLLGGLIAALDVAIVAAMAGLLSRAAASTTLAEFNPHTLAVLFACAMPLAWHKATVESGTHAEEATSLVGPGERSTRFKVLWARAEAVYRRMRPGIMLGLILTVGTTAVWLVLGAAWITHLVLRARQRVVVQSAQPTLQWFFRPYLPTLFNGFLVCLFLAAWGNSHTLPATGTIASRWVMPSHVNPDGFAALSEIRNGLFERPLFGSGPGSFPLQVPEFSRIAWLSIAPTSPNTWLRSLVESGLVTTLAALGAWCFIGAHALSRFWKSSRSEETKKPDSRMPALLASLLATTIATGFFDFSSAPFMAFFGVASLALTAQSLVANSDGTKAIALRRRVAKRAMVCATLFLVALQLIIQMPRVWNMWQAQKFYEQAQHSGTLSTRFTGLLQARDHNPENAFYWAQAGKVKFEIDGPTAARATTNFFRQAAHRAPHDAWWWHNLGALYLIANDYPQAIRNSSRAIEADPNWWLAHLQLAHALRRQGDLARSRKEHRIARALWSKYFGRYERASMANIRSASNSERYRRPFVNDQLIVAPVVLADRDFFVVNSK